MGWTQRTLKRGWTVATQQLLPGRSSPESPLHSRLRLLPWYPVKQEKSMMYLRRFVVGCFLSVSVMFTAASEGQPPTSIVTACRVTTTGVGRYTMAPFQDTLVLLDSRTGRTWLLRKQDGQPAVWAPIAGPGPGKAELATESSTFGEVEIRSIPEKNGPIILGRSTKKRADTADSLRRTENDGYRSYDGQTVPQEDRRTKR